MGGGDSRGMEEVRVMLEGRGDSGFKEMNWGFWVFSRLGVGLEVLWCGEVVGGGDV